MNRRALSCTVRAPSLTHHSGHPSVSEEVNVEVGRQTKSTPEVSVLRGPGHQLGFVPVNIVPVALEGWTDG